MEHQKRESELYTLKVHTRGIFQASNVILDTSPKPVKVRITYKTFIPVHATFT